MIGLFVELYFLRGFMVGIIVGFCFGFCWLRVQHAIPTRSIAGPNQSIACDLENSSSPWQILYSISHHRVRSAVFDNHAPVALRLLVNQ